ncbi:MAG: DoxX family protein [Bacteroidetes bacterium HGW-Bacteroidetes-17]|jgi:uncharacterized membrane protein YphA (DoxX/SURF4 family)|nr:MAG: DoxX family protein [Bacteroidetes bacterium HGW-Bacteroidetes-17]
MKLLRTVSCILVGLVFIFSGFVKGVDPLGTAYKIEDYFIAYGMDWAMPLALFLSISLCMVEFVLGYSLVLNLRLKQLSWLLLAMMSFFTLVTLYDALYSPVPDCGCFGDAITLTNWQTFYKNLVLMVFVLLIFTSKKKFKSIFNPKIDIVLILIGIVGFSWFSIYQYRHLPMIDFREWKVGTDLTPDSEREDEIFLIYKNTKTGETQEYLSPNYPWNDSVWMSEWEFVDQRVVEHSGIQLHNLRFEDLSGSDLTDEIIHKSDYQLFIVTWNVNKFPDKAISQIKSLVENVTSRESSIHGLTSSLSEDIEQFQAKTGIDLVFYNSDDIVLKTMIRANPGIVLLKDGEILAKWHYNDCPDIVELERKFPGF